MSATAYPVKAVDVAIDLIQFPVVVSLPGPTTVGVDKSDLTVEEDNGTIVRVDPPVDEPVLDTIETELIDALPQDAIVEQRRRGEWAITQPAN